LNEQAYGSQRPRVITGGVFFISEGMIWCHAICFQAEREKKKAFSSGVFVGIMKIKVFQHRP
jgi:hypothetical protein